VIVNVRACPIFNTDVTVRTCAWPALVAAAGAKTPPSDTVHE